jgi:hypothetical protein
VFGLSRIVSLGPYSLANNFYLEGKMTANSTERIHITKEFLNNLWSNLLYLIEIKGRKRKVEYFLRNTNKEDRRIYENSMVIRGTQTYFPNDSLLTRDKTLEGVWMSLCFHGDKKPERLPFGTQCILLPAYDVINYLKTVEESSLQDMEIILDEEENDEVELSCEREECRGADDDLKIHSVRKMKRRKPKRIPRRDLMENFQKKKWTREDFLKNPNEIKLLEKEQAVDIKTCLKEIKTEDPLLFFENAFYCNEGTQYIRMVLISAEDIHVKLCREHLLQVSLYENPVLQVNDGVVMTVSCIRPKLVVDVLVVGDIELRKINVHSWFTVRKLARAGKEPVIAVLSPKMQAYR